ncbi:MAG: helix-turn-helix domain-containing protein, partial [Candidatus Niyogibacteria bacterium]|nr:helix-turn-helix domain-containing protein [Candidatus Niyogibacteria bacterium]
MARHQIPKIWRNDKEFLSLTYAASFAGYHKERLRQLIQENKLSAERINGVWFIEKSVLQNFITENTGVKRISELPKLDSVTQKNNSKSIYRFFSASSQKTDPWDALLLGDLAPKKYSKPFNPFKYLFSFKSLFSPLIIKSLVLFLIFATAGFFILRNPDAALAKYNDFKNALSKIVPASKEIAVLTLNSLKTKSADIRQDLSYVIDQTALVLDNSSVGIADIAKNSVSKFKSFSVSVSESLKNISQFKSSKVSKFQSFKVSRFQGFKVSKFLDFNFSKFQDFNFSKFQDFKLSISQGLNFPKLKNFKISKIQGLKLPKFQSFKFPNFANVVSERFQDIAESRPLDYVKNKVRIAGKETGSFTLDLKNKIEEVPLKVGKYAGSLTGRGADKAIEKTKETLVGIYDKTFEVLGRLPEVPKEEEVAEKEEPRDLTILRSQGLEPATNQISTPEPKQQPTIAERVVTERVVERVLAGLSKTDLDLALSGVNARILAEVSELKKEIAKRANDNFAAIALTNRINQLSGVTISTATVSGVSGLTDADIPNDITATNYLPLSGGTLTGGLTISSGGATITGALSASSLSIPNASSSLSSIFNTLYIGGVATTTFSTTASSFDITANATTTLGTTGLNIGSDQFVIQQNSGRVGISTSSPSVTFHLEEADGINTGLAIGGDGVTSSARFWIGDSTNLWRMQTTSGNLLYTS